ncbi:site-specific DNA-methyltransferase [Methylovorus glucosotrophus]|uniref:Methyltransferase n=1 Tax=Methylovorus glucosotrophus (strain SIP3-4) TaxID=582744 RepID=C6XEN6_METGS|nr:site-specific DNA-methyltransferase [Methylovorus glucosotrophus]ACT52093.1 DNA methylase N-4/N-6 domain protein [Methylovorus glucosotrophus SIP3-4]
MSKKKTMKCELDLFSEILHAYPSEGDRGLSNASLYERIADRAQLSPEDLNARAPVGESKQPVNLLKRRIRWFQQTLKHAGILERVDGERGVWKLTNPAGDGLRKINPGVSVLGFSTKLGLAILGSCDTVFSRLDTPIHLCVTSPPYPLASQRAYGNPNEGDFVDWLCRSIEPVVKNLVNGGSICLNIGNDIFISGSPARSLYQERLLLALHDRLGLSLMDRLVWHNPSKPPGPVQWASLNRVQLNVAWEPVYWLTNNPNAVRSDNRRVLQEHTERHLNFIRNGGIKARSSASDGAYIKRIGAYSTETLGRIPRNVLTFGHACQDQRNYKQFAKNVGLPAHGAAMPLSLASFLIEFLSRPDDLVVDPFGGSFSTAKAAEQLGRRWLSTECMIEYVLGASVRFKEFDGFGLSLNG